MDYTKTQLWNNSLCNTSYGEDDLRATLTSAYMKARDNAAYLLSKIRTDFPNLTVHDISHVDGLWQVASVIVGADYKINPLEGFVLGCAFLMHDAVLSYEAVGGVENLRNCDTWRDYYKDYKKIDSLTPEEQIYETDFLTIRKLHANRAISLYDQIFVREDGTSFFIIEDTFLRRHFGAIICRIAASHHWEYDSVLTLGNQIPPPAEYPQEWRISPVKLACILRCSDAGHLDNGRAPDHLLDLLSTNQVSKNHWIAQNRLSQIDLDRQDDHKVIIKSNIPFKEEDFAAWNVAYDAIQMLDHELREADEFLRSAGEDPFQVKAVSGAGSRERLSKYIETEGWKPFDAEIHISDIEQLIYNLGGERLYGRERKLEIVLRELIQNARDSIVARRTWEPGFDGEVSIDIQKRKGKIWISVTDNGLGMSMSTVKNYLLNFGSSFWSSDSAKREYPGLNSSGYKSIGQFGIGFFSVFMVADEVIVETRKYDSALDNTFQLKFPTGLCLRPIISQKAGATSVSTKVLFSIDEKKAAWNGLFTINPGRLGESPFDIPYAALLSNLTCGIDVDVYYTELGGTRKKIHMNFEKIQEGSLELLQWLKDITYADYREDKIFSKYIDDNYMRVRKIMHKGRCYGMAALNTLWIHASTLFDIHTVGGLSNFGHASGNGDFLGCVFEEPVTARRDGEYKGVEMKDWVKEQYNMLHNIGLTDLDRVYLPYILGKYEICMIDVMMIAVFDCDGKKYVWPLLLFVELLNRERKKLVIPISAYSSSNRVESYTDYGRTVSRLKTDEFLFISNKNTDFLSLKENDEEYAFNLNYCLSEAGNCLGYTIQKTTEENKAIAHMNTLCRAVIVTYCEEL